jgi:hypothetical protein
MEGTVQHQADAACLGRMDVGKLELAENLRLADHHRIQTGADTKQMARGVTACEPIERAGKERRINFAVGGENIYSFIAGAGGISRHADYLDPVAGRDQHGFGDCRRTLPEPAERRHDLFIGIREPFADRDRSNAMVNADNEQRFVYYLWSTSFICPFRLIEMCRPLARRIMCPNCIQASPYRWGVHQRKEMCGIGHKKPIKVSRRCPKVATGH